MSSSLSSSGALHALLSEWQVINATLAQATAESWQRYPFYRPYCDPPTKQPTSSDSGGGDDDGEMSPSNVITSGADLFGTGTTPLSQGAATQVALYRRAYALLGQLRVLEQEYSSPILLQHLLWSSVWGWLAQMSRATGHRLSLPPASAFTTTEETAEAAAAAGICWAEHCPVLSPAIVEWQGAESARLWHAALVDTYTHWEHHPTRWEDFAMDSVDDDGVDSGFAAFRVPVSPSDAELGSPLFRPALTEEEAPASLHALVTFSRHYHAMRQLLGYAFIRLDSTTANRKSGGGATKTKTVALRLLTFAVQRVLEYNQTWIAAVLRYAATRALSEASERASWSAPATPRGKRDGSSYFHVGDVAVTETPPLALPAPEAEADLLFLSRLHQMLEDCIVEPLMTWRLRVVEESCRVLGLATADHTLGSVLEDEPPRITSTGAVPPRSAALVEVNRVLREATQGFVRLRATLLLFLAGTTHFLDDLSADGWECLRCGMRGFLAGFNSDGAMWSFVEAWSVPLWLQLCEEAHQRQQWERVGAGRSGGKAKPSASTAAVAHERGERSVQHDGSPLAAPGPTAVAAAAAAAATSNAAGEETVATTTVRDFGEADSQSVNTEQDRRAWLQQALNAGRTTEEEEVQLQAHQLALIPADGFPSLLYLLPRDEAPRRKLLMCFAHHVQLYLCELLQAQDEADGGTAGTGWAGRDGPPTTPLPSAVLEQCIFTLKMTQVALEEENLGAGWPAGGTTNSSRNSGGGSTSTSATVALGETMTTTTTSVGGLWLNGWDGDVAWGAASTAGPPSGGQHRSVWRQTPSEAALFAVRRGIQSFFAATETRVALTLAHAIHEQVLDCLAHCSAQSRTAATTTTASTGARMTPAAVAVVDTLLSLAALVPSRELFAKCYESLIAPRLLALPMGSAAPPASFIDVDSEVVRQMARRLGQPVVGSCVTLLRDFSHALDDVRVRAATDRMARDLEPVNSSGVARPFLAQTDERVSAPQRVMASPTPLPSLGPSAVSAAKTGRVWLLRHLRILCLSWWSPYTSVIASTRRLRRLWEKGHWLDERLVGTAMHVEWYYSGQEEAFAGYGSYGVVGTRASEINQPEHVTVSSADGGAHHSKGEPSHHARGGSYSSTQSVPHSTSSVMQGLSSAVQQGGSRLYGNLRRTGRRSGAFGNDDGEDTVEDDFRAAYGGLLHHSLPVPSGGGAGGIGAGLSVSAMLFRQYASSVSSLGASTDVPSEVGSSASPSPTSSREARNVERRRLRWPLASGQLTFLVHAAVDAGASSAAAVAVASSPRTEVVNASNAVDTPAATTSTAAPRSVQITGPPITLLLLQVLDRFAAHSLRGREGEVDQPHTAFATPCTFDALCSAMPLETPKPILASLLSSLLRAGIVERASGADGDGSAKPNVYRLSPGLERVKNSKIVVEISTAVPPRQWMQATEAAGEDRRRVATSSSPCVDQGSFDSATATDSTPLPQQRGRHRSPVSGGNRDGSGNRTAASASSAVQTSALVAAREQKVSMCVVCVLKAARVMAHGELLGQVTELLQRQFPVTVPMFKRAVGVLIEREYVRRNDNGDYEYVA